MLRQHCCIAVCLLLSGSIGLLVHAEFYSSIDSMNALGQVEKELVAATYVYLTERLQQLNVLTSFVERVSREHAFARQELEQDEEYLEQPLQAFRLTKRLVVDWPELHKLLITNQAKETFRVTVDAISTAVGIPNEEELQGAVKGLLRLQRVYNLTASELADGILHGVPTGSVLLWRDCFEIGVQLYELAEYSSSQQWLLQAVNLLHEIDGENVQQMAEQIYEYLVLTQIELCEREQGLETLEEMLSWNSGHSPHPAQYTLNFLQQSMPKCPREQDPAPWLDDYTRLCQGKRLSEPEPSGSPLNCYLDFTRHARFRLAPLKVEQVHLDPDIHIYYDLINDDQIDAIYDVAEQFDSIRSSVSSSIVTDVRVSQQVWLNYSSPILRSVSNLVGAVTGFDMENAEQIQVANYGIGGQYAPHTDYMSKMPDSYIPRGNRIATNMFYLSDVLNGGYTVFPNLNVFLKPVKGAMVSWHNLYRSLNKDSRTLHAGCPVLEGVKRIGNIWIHSTLQEFRRPCTLNANE
ncbi:prolyl 4-hydroxylase subunit alpha-1 [Drosophila montana]|uniref:prolyl 4-hydroxylase subunit alpha-1 n=1 Tax=Drosophila montana TaxID=40370 RepID=UPI00313A9FF9